MASDTMTGQLGETMDFDQMYNARLVLNKKTLNTRLALSRQQHMSSVAAAAGNTPTDNGINTSMQELHDTSAEKDLENALDLSIDSSFAVTTGKIPLRQGLLFWLATHRGCYFLVRTVFQLLAFSLLIVTLVMLTEFQSAYWRVTVYLLVAMHATDLLSFSLDLISFARRSVQLLRYKIGLDILSFGLSLVMQTYFGASLSDRVEQQ